MLSLLMLLLMPALSSALGVDSLWARALTLSEANGDWVPGSIYVHMQEVDKHGEPKQDKVKEVWSRLYLGEGGEVESEILKVLDSGKDVTEEERARREREEVEENDGRDDEKDDDGDGRVTVEGYSPFDPGKQDGVTVKPTGLEQVIDGKHCAVFEFEDRREGDEDGDDDGLVFTGKAWLETGTGIPVRIEFTSDPLPKRVKRMDTTVTYEYAGPDSWYARSTHVEATGGFLFIKKHFRMDMTFSDYWRLPEEQPETVEADESAVPE